MGRKKKKVVSVARLRYEAKVNELINLKLDLSSALARRSSGEDVCDVIRMLRADIMRVKRHITRVEVSVNDDIEVS